MNQIELITGLPNWQWKANSQREIEMTGEELVIESDFVWRIGKAAVIGFIHTSYTTPPWVWFVLAENIRFSDLIDFRRLQHLIPKGSLTAVALDYPIAERFAKFHGFEDTGEEIANAGRDYKVMRKN